MADTNSEPAVDREAEVSLREIHAETLFGVLKLDVSPSQRQFVAPNSVSIAQAHFSPEAWFRGIYAGEVPVGFVMLADSAQLSGDAYKEDYYLWRFMIDQRYQGMGFGRRALDLVVEHVRGRPNAQSLGTSTVPGEGSPRPFYEKYGFVATGEVDDGEEVLRLSL